MSETEVEAEREPTDDASEEDVDELDERAERVVEHARHLEELREEKRTDLVPEEEDTNDDQDAADSSPVLTGWIRDARVDGDEYVLDVDVQDGSTTTRESFRLDWPEDTDDLHISNPVVRLAHLVGESDSLDDILEQTIPIRRVDDGYEIDLPATPSRRDRFSHWTTRRLLDSGLLRYDDGEVKAHPTAANATTLAISLPLGAYALTTFGSLAAAASSVPFLGGFIGSGGIGVVGLMVTLFGAVIIAEEFETTPVDSDSVFIGVILLTVLAATAVNLATAAPSLTAIENSPAALGIALLSATSGATAFALSALGLVSAGSDILSAAVEKGRDRLDRTRRWWKQRRGVEYVE